MLTLSARSKDIKKFVSEVADYETYLITGEYPGNRPVGQMVYKKICLSVRPEDDDLGHSIQLDISKYPITLTYCKDIENKDYYGKVNSFRAYDKREKKNDERLENCKVIEWGYAGIVIMCEEESIVILSPKNKTKYTTIDGKLHTINKCCECPYVDTEYAMCRYPNSKDIPITDYEGISKGCMLRDEE